jgi:flavin reductase (DIM6/NTAB) family NADH-FMN oxidoreductase RutF
MKTKLGAKPLILPMPALLVGTYSDDGTPNAMTAAWTGVCCHRPLLVGVAIRRSRKTFANAEKRKAFTLNVPSTDFAREVDYLGIVSGSVEPGKLEVARLKTENASTVDAPIITQCPVNIECQLAQTVPLGSHTWFVGEVVEVQITDELVNDDGGIDTQALDPLIYVTTDSHYYSLGETVGQAFSMGKGLKKA